MVTITIYVDENGFVGIYNTANKSINLDDTEHGTQIVFLKKINKYPYEVQVPIVCLSDFLEKNYAKVSLEKLRNTLHKGEE